MEYTLSEPKLVEDRGPYAKKYCWRINIRLNNERCSDCGFMETNSFNQKKDAKRYLKEEGWIGMAHGKGGYCVPKIDPDPHKVAVAVIKTELSYSKELNL